MKRALLLASALSMAVAAAAPAFAQDHRDYGDHRNYTDQRDYGDHREDHADRGDWAPVIVVHHGRRGYWDERHHWREARFERHHGRHGFWDHHHHWHDWDR